MKPSSFTVATATCWSTTWSDSTGTPDLWNYMQVPGRFRKILLPGVCLRSSKGWLTVLFSADIVREGLKDPLILPKTKVYETATIFPHFPVL